MIARAVDRFPARFGPMGMGRPSDLAEGIPAISDDRRQTTITDRQ
jgi:hypothetical protein